MSKINRRDFFKKTAKGLAGTSLIGMGALGGLEKKAVASEIASGKFMFWNYLNNEVLKGKSSKNVFANYIFVSVDRGLPNTIYEIVVNNKLDGKLVFDIEKTVTESINKAVIDLGCKIVYDINHCLISYDCHALYIDRMVVDNYIVIDFGVITPSNPTSEQNEKVNEAGKKIIAKYFSYVWKDFSDFGHHHYNLPKERGSQAFVDFLDFNQGWPLCKVSWNDNVGVITRRGKDVLKSFENAGLVPYLKEEGIKIL